MRQRVPAAPSSYRRADQPTGDGVGLTNRLGETVRLCETLSSWRLLVGGLSPGASHHSFTTSSEEPPLSNFNSYWDISQQQRQAYQARWNGHIRRSFVVWLLPILVMYIGGYTTRWVYQGFARPKV